MESSGSHVGRSWLEKKPDRHWALGLLKRYLLAYTRKRVHKKAVLTSIAIALRAGIPDSEIGSVLRESGFGWDRERNDVVIERTIKQ